MAKKLCIKSQICLAKEMVMYNDGNRWLEYQRIAVPVMRAVKNAANDDGWFNQVILTHRERKRLQRPLTQKMSPTTVRVKIHDRKNRFVESGRP